ncbi:D-2-hydroxyacid dehydrogenase [Cupriavidus consociatus]|uniref:D-2-hydroxyacid dehydrogenase n=1 Tax=Cupriavidus consociatus TaxID=2821357 RepID=UPI001AE38454|nr:MULTISPECIES: D-2-hydroxyacid dehydrogenase [unclassified Cupriavidus]MBP0623349.1 D-2-hydroxyacid dehydrogenase [Cupriavidus sp. LEh25]MDK2660047.1 D-2-hydroxyacid dehydrogenase [Cupriavidus sp. LEh21]
MKFVFYGAFGRDVVGPAIAAAPGVVLQYADTAETLAEYLADADAFVTVGPAYTPAVANAVASASKLQWIQTLSAGFETLERLGVPAHITVTNAGDSWSIAVAEHAMALLLALAKQIPDAVRQQGSHAWDRRVMPRMSNLQGRTMVIAGFGSIGQAVAQRAKAFGMRIVAVTRNIKPSDLADAVFPPEELHEALQQADALVIAVPGQADTVRMFNQAVFLACKKGCVVINVSRGNVVEQKALADALKSGHLGGAGLDVTEIEPLPEADAFWDMPNLLITPHVAGGGELVKEKLAALIIDNINRKKRGDNLRFVVMRGRGIDGGRDSSA